MPKSTIDLTLSERIALENLLDAMLASDDSDPDRPLWQSVLDKLRAQAAWARGRGGSTPTGLPRGDSK